MRAAKELCTRGRAWTGPLQRMQAVWIPHLREGGLAVHIHVVQRQLRKCVMDESYG